MVTAGAFAARGTAARAPVVGVALSANRLVAAWTLSDGALDTRDLAVDTSGADGWSTLHAALHQVLDGWRATWRDRPCTVRIAMLAPLVEVRTVSLPPVSNHDAQRLLARAAARHFLSATEPVVVGVSSPTAADGGVTTRVAAAASVRLLRAVREAVTAAGGTLGDVVPALVTWSLGDIAGRAPHGVVEVSDSLLELVTWQDSAPTAVRRFARPDDLLSLCDACVALRGAVTLIAEQPEDAAIAQALTQHGVSLTRAPANTPEPATRSAAMRAAWRLATTPWLANAEALPLALSDSAHESLAPSVAASGASRRRVLLVAGLLLLAAAGVYRVGILRELQAVRAERAAMAPSLDSLGLRARTDDPLAVDRAVRASARTAVPWARVLATLGVTLPRDAHLLAVRAMGDTIVFDGLARDAGAVFASLEQARFTDVTAAAPVRRERSVSGDVTERFTFRARVPHRRADTPSPRMAERTP